MAGQTDKPAQIGELHINFPTMRGSDLLRPGLTKQRFLPAGSGTPSIRTRLAFLEKTAGNTPRAKGGRVLPRVLTSGLRRWSSGPRRRAARRQEQHWSDNGHSLVSPGLTQPLIWLNPAVLARLLSVVILVAAVDRAPGKEVTRSPTTRKFSSCFNRWLASNPMLSALS